MTSESLMLAIGILSASFFGSWHCGAMCGPVATLMKSRGLLFSYHFGRFISYTALGVLAGSAGSYLLQSDFRILRFASAGVLAFSLALIGLRLLFPLRFQNLRLQGPIARRIHSLGPTKGFLNSGLLMGLSSALLPCGWLYTYALAASTTQSPFAGGLTMMLFWLGGLPMLSAVPAMIKKGIASAGLQQQRIAGGILVASSLYSLGMFFIA